MVMKQEGQQSELLKKEDKIVKLNRRRARRRYKRYRNGAEPASQGQDQPCSLEDGS